MASTKIQRTPFHDMKKIGIYGGSFDPIHLGHVNLAVEMIEKHHLDEVWFCPASINPYPHKQEKQGTSPKDRLAMIELAIENNPQLKICDVELHRPGPSFTLDTLHQLIDMYPDYSFSLIIGYDAAQSFHKWHKPEEIAQLVPIYVGARGSETGEFEGSKEVVNSLKKGLTKTRLMDICSSEIRQRLGNKRYCGHLLQRKVLDYILSHRLYL